MYLKTLIDNITSETDIKKRRMWSSRPQMKQIICDNNEFVLLINYLHFNLFGFFFSFTNKMINFREPAGDDCSYSKVALCPHTYSEIGKYMHVHIVFVSVECVLMCFHSFKPLN